ncbi:MAG TPA: ISL3 family transposase [Acidimicrobiales bacterium]|nr:ISL3 family transposase [Acidimicrobiales bacterium]
MRVSTAFNKMLGVVGASVAGVTFTPEGVVVALRRRRRKLVCRCGWKTWASYDHRRRRWRHVDLGGTKVWLEADVRRLECRRCRRVTTEVVPWARPGARHTRDLQDVVAWLAQRTDKTTICTLLRVSWEAVAKIVVDVVAEHVDAARLDGLYRIGVDEVSYRRGHRFLTVVADHDRAGAVVWAKEGLDSKTLQTFYDELGPERSARLEAVSMDMGNAWAHATTLKAPQARQCVDPFHVVALANRALDKTRMGEYRARRAVVLAQPRRGRGRPRRGEPSPTGPRRAMLAVRYTRWALLKDPARLTDEQQATLWELKKQRSVLYRGWQLKEGLRDLYRLADPQDAPAHLDWWLAWACRSRVPSFVALSKTVRVNRERVLAAVELGLSNSKLEGLNSKIRLINHRGYGHHSAPALIAMIYLCAGGVTIDLPFR